MKTILALLILTSLGLGQAPFVDPYTSAERVFDIPIGAKYGLAFHTDTMHVTTSEQGWLLADECVAFTVINPNANYVLWRMYNAAGADVQAYLGDYGTLEVVAPGMIKSGYGLDSLFMDGESACTVYVYWWSLD